MGSQAIQRANDSRFDTWTSPFNIEVADDLKRAVLTVPLMHVGPNKKGLYWTPEMLKNIAPMFRGVAFRYDLDGQEGSSHTTNKLSSPHFDVGWTYKNAEGAWYDDKSGTLFVKGEVTHPQVVQKLARKTTDGQREINYASMGVIVENAKCSICGSEYGECEHERLKPYNMETAYKVPTVVSKALHAALTNDPADGEAEIGECIFQELGGNNMDDKKYDNIFKGNQKENTDQASPNEMKNSPTSKVNTDGTSPGIQSPSNNQIPGGLAPSSPQTDQPGPAPSHQDILRDLAERVRTIENKVSSQDATQGTPELVNSAPQDQFTQDNMGVTAQFENEGDVTNDFTGGKEKMDIKDGQSTNDKTALNPDKPEMADMGSVIQALQNVIAMLSGNQEMSDMGKESLSAGKGQAQKAQDNIPTEHQGEGAVSSDDTDEGAKKNRANMQNPGAVATADNAEKPKEDSPANNADEETADAEKNAMKQELADLQATVKGLKGKLEIQDGEVPEFGGTTQTSNAKADVADMSADERHQKYGKYGAYDAIFNGSASAQRFEQ